MPQLPVVTSKVCMVYTWDHHKHVMIRREISTLSAAGCQVVVHDFLAGRTTVYSGNARQEVKPDPVLRALRRFAAFLMVRAESLGARDNGWNVFDELRFLIGIARSVLILARTRADLYQAHDLMSLVSSSLAARMRRVPVVYDAHELESEQGCPGSPANCHLRGLERKFIGQADLVIVPNRFRAEHYTSTCGLTKAPVIVMNCAPLQPYQHSRALHDRLALKPETRIVLYHGTFMAGRGLENLVLASRFFGEDTVLVMIGERNQFCRVALEPLVESPGVRGKTFFVPYVEPDEIMRYVASAQLGVVTYEPINLNNLYCAPTKMYEFIMAGVPILGNDLPEIRALLAEFRVGVMVDSLEPHRIADAVNHFFSGPLAEGSQLADMMERARRRYNWETEGQKLVCALLGISARRLRERQDRGLDV